MPGPPIETAVLTASGATQSRRLDEFASGDVVNVKDFGALGDNSHNDAPNIQNAINVAFGTAIAPHGTASHLNKALFFPNGQYLCNSTLIMTAVKNGHIFGSVSSALQAPTGVSNFTLLRINGMEDTLFENFSFVLTTSSTNGICVDLNWDGGTPTDFGVGLGRNFFRKSGAWGGGATTNSTAFRIAASGHEGAGNAWWNSVVEATGIGWHLVGTDATAQSYQALSLAAECNIGWKVDGGEVGIISGISNAGGASNQLDIQINNASTVCVSGGRSEAPRLLELNVAGAKAVLSSLQTGSNVTGDGVKMVPGTVLLADAVNTPTIIATSPGTEPKPILYRRGGQTWRLPLVNANFNRIQDI